MKKYYYEEDREKPVTIQRTSKSWKFLFVLAWIVGIIGILCADTEDGVMVAIGVGGAIYYYAKLGRWWNNL